MSQRSSVRAGRATTLNGRRRRSGLHHPAKTGLRHRRGLRIALFVLAAISGLGLVGVAVVFAEYQNLKSQLPDASTLAAMEPPLDSHVYDRAGTLIAVLHNSDFRHEHIALDQISNWVRLATVDVEDRHFYEHSSWDLPRIMKAAYQNLRHEANAGGASTITEQLAKISFLSPERSLDRKIKQVILGAEIESNFTKQQILEMYLNRIAYGNHAIGIQTAAEVYFQKSAHDLDLAEASMLACLPNSPTALNPLNHDVGVDVNPLAKQRQKVVLQAMVSNQDITQPQADAAYAEKLAYHYWYESEPQTDLNFLDFLTRWLDDKFGDAYKKPGGWNIYATIDPTKQAQAQKAVHDGVAAISKQYNAHDGSLVSMDPKTGEVLAMVGAWDPTDNVVNDRNLVLERRQPGSTIKLFTYTSAIASREFTMTTPVLDAPITLRDGSASGYSPKNYDRSWHGVCQLQQCLGNSFNVPAVKVEAKVGIPMITDVEIAAGLKSLNSKCGYLNQESNRPGPTSYAATLGGLTCGITPLDLADGVSTIADLGVQHDPTPVVRITERGSSKVVYVHDAVREGLQVVPANVAFIMSEITSNDHNRAREFGPGGDLTLKDRRVSAKTGTTESFVSNWTVGWTPDLVSVVFVGNPWASCMNPTDRDRLRTILRNRHSDVDVDTYPFSPDEIRSYKLTPINDHCGPLLGSSGITGAAPIWNTYMKQALAGTPKHWYTKPADVVEYGHGDDGVFYIPGTESTAACYYYGPKPDPTSSCTYSGTTPPTPSPTPTPGAPTPAPLPPVPLYGQPSPTPRPHHH
jgi:membrane peptidoglycan carboxypeptidase